MDGLMLVFARGLLNCGCVRPYLVEGVLANLKGECRVKVFALPHSQGGLLLLEEYPVQGGNNPTDRNPLVTLGKNGSKGGLKLGWHGPYRET